MKPSLVITARLFSPWRRPAALPLFSRGAAVVFGAALLSGCVTGVPAEDSDLRVPPRSTIAVGEPNPAAPGGCPECTPVLADLSPEAVKAADPFLWLEEVEGAQALAWVRDQNARTKAVLETDPRYPRFREQALSILTATDRIPAPSFRAGGVDNFWQDKANVKGLWRRATLDSYRTAQPRWETILDIDALARAEGRNWIFKGDRCLEPEERLCLVSLSDGGKDAVVVREFDTRTKRFLPGGFTLPEGKHRFDWLDRDTLLVATDFGPGTLTESGYPYIVRELKRGQTLAQAREVFRGDAKDGGYGVEPYVLRDPRGVLQGVVIERPIDTFNAEHHLLTPSGAQRMDLPAKATLHGWHEGRLVFTSGEPWNGFPAGALLATAFVTEAGPGPAPTIVLFSPTPRQAVEQVAITADRVAAVVYDEVRGRLMTFDMGPTGATRTDIALPDNSTVTLSATTTASNRMLVNVQGFVTPSTLFLADAAAGGSVQIKALPARFDAANATVEQFTAASRDGTRIPYFVTRPKQLPASGAPAILFGYGGFAVAKPPVYIAEMGKLWLENGGVFVNANIRGGGEFGPAWHQSVLKANRQGAFDDFAAVAEDLIRRGITTPDQLGVYGRSNGGVLTSVSMTQRPELFDAAVIESPLVDMLRYHELPAGASWIGEYGDPRIPEEAAFIARYSAYQNIPPRSAQGGKRLPEPYITTNTRDDRVHPGHARKFAARLQALGHPALYYENTEGGHSNDSDPVLNAERWARHYVYLSRKLMDGGEQAASGARSTAAPGDAR